MVSFAVALIFTQGSGNYWVEVFNGYVGSVPLLIIALFEIIGVIYVYGMKKYIFFLFIYLFAPLFFFLFNFLTLGQQLQR